MQISTPSCGLTPRVREPARRLVDLRPHALREPGKALAAAVPAWDPKQPPPVALDPAQDAWAVETARRMVFLRLASTIPSVQAVPLLSLGGALACSWTDPARFGPLLGGWSRVMRWRLLWGALIPDADALRWLARG